MPGFRVCNVVTESALPDKFPERCVRGILFFGGGGYCSKANPEQVFT